MSTSKIAWTDKVWNPITGCTPASEGCRNCYAKRMANRHRGRNGYPADEPFRVTTRPDRLDMPLRWQKPKKIFVDSMGDLFHADVPDEFIARVWFEMGQCACSMDPARRRGHIFQILTKRPARMRKWLAKWADVDTRGKWIEAMGKVYDWASGPKYWPTALPNVWLGTSVENPGNMPRVKDLIKTPAAIRFISLEPMLGATNLWLPTKTYTRDGIPRCNHCCNLHCDDRTHLHRRECPYCRGTGNGRPIDWVIVGGESGPGARPIHPQWVRDIRDQCSAAGVAYFFKQWGEWAPAYPQYGGDDYDIDEAIMQCPFSDQVKQVCLELSGAEPQGTTKGINWCHHQPHQGAWWMYRVGTKVAGNKLDEKLWEQFPAVGR